MTLPDDINVKGGFLSLFTVAGSDTVLIDSVTVPDIYSGISYGRFPDGSKNWYQLLNPTPGQKNIYDPSKGERNNLSLLLKSYPNPFNDYTNISMYLNNDNQYYIHIFDINGSLQRKISLEQKRGYQIVTWDGTDKNKKQVPSGIYFCSLYSENLLDTKKLLFLR